MKNVVKTLKIIWPSYSTANTMCRILDRLEDDLISYWEPYWDGERDEIGIRFASEEGEIAACPGCVVLIEDGHAVRMRKNLKDENDPTTRIDERKRTVARIYYPGNLKDLRVLSEGGHRIEIDEGRMVVHDRDDVVETAGCWIVEDANTRRIRVEQREAPADLDPVAARRQLDQILETVPVVDGPEVLHDVTHLRSASRRAPRR